MTSAERIRAIEGSLRCFALGLAALIPLLGLPVACVALYCHAKVRSLAGDDWNPAHFYLKLGHALAWVGIGVTAALIGLVGSYVVQNYSELF